ncbi:CNT_collapsed_G0049100.mRNA.1.CDS.1 [Saccharomyces cerevisiae]|nr:CNT_collapsed_G0049100.mRNA.1.CDS.1 [Saccharomyces cerevisiae]
MNIDSSIIIASLKVQWNSQDGNCIIGVAFIDTTAYKVGMLDIVDNEVYSNLESFLIQLGVKECLVQDLTSNSNSNAEMQKVINVIDRCGCVVTLLKNSEFSEKDVELDLTKLLGDDLALSLPQKYSKLSMGACNALIGYLQLLSEQDQVGKYELVEHKLKEFMKLDASAIKALNLFPQGPQNPFGSNNLAVSGFTSAGNSGKVTSLFHKRIPEIVQVFTSFLEDDSPTEPVKELVRSVWLAPLSHHVEPLSKFEEMVETTVDLDAYEENNEFMIKVEFNEELGKIRSKLDALRDEIHSIHLDSAEDLGFDPDKKLKLENHHLHGWCMRLTRNDAKELRKHKKYIELSTVKAGIFFSTKQLKSIANETNILQKEYDKQQSALVREIINITLTYTPVFEKLSLVLAHLDVIASFAHTSSYAPIPYIRPKLHPMDSERRTHLISSRHPVLEMQDDISFISNDVTLESGKGDFLIITGPNMGGKSTYIRQVGVISLMAQIGCFVPCEEAEIAIVDAILCRVGAGDSQLKGVSTFMVEILETASILKNASKNSLIIVDELGRGTSTYDGFGLAWAIAEHIAIVQFPEKIVKMAKRKANELDDLKTNNEDLKKAKLSLQEVNEGNIRLKALLKEWIRKVKEEGLHDPSKITEEASQHKIQELLRAIANEPEKENDNYLKYIKALLL